MTTGRRGFTLVEAVMASAGMGMILIVISSLLLQVTRFNRQVSARGEVQRSARVALSAMEREVSQARGRTIVIDRLDAAQPPYSRMSFSGPDGRTVSFYQSGTRLLRRVTAAGGTNTSVLASDLRQVVFAYPSSDNSALLSIGVTFERGTYQGSSKSLQLALSKVRIQNPDAY